MAMSCFGSNPNNEITSLYVKAKANVISNNPYNASKKLPNSLLKIQYTIYRADWNSVVIWFQNQKSKSYHKI